MPTFSKSKSAKNFTSSSAKPSGKPSFKSNSSGSSSGQRSFSPRNTHPKDDSLQKRSGKFRKIYKNDKRHQPEFFEEADNETQESRPKSSTKSAYGDKFKKPSFNQSQDKYPSSYSRDKASRGSKSNERKSGERKETGETESWHRSNKFEKPESWRTGPSIAKRLSSKGQSGFKKPFSEEKVEKTRKIRNVQPKKGLEQNKDYVATRQNSDFGPSESQNSTTNKFETNRKKTSTLSSTKNSNSDLKKFETKSENWETVNLDAKPTRTYKKEANSQNDSELKTEQRLKRTAKKKQQRQATKDFLSGGQSTDSKTKPFLEKKSQLVNHFESSQLPKNPDYPSQFEPQNDNLPTLKSSDLNQNFHSSEEVLNSVESKNREQLASKEVVQSLNSQNLESLKPEPAKIPMLPKADLPQVVILYGPPASGKGTQADFLKKLLPEYYHLDFGTALREFVSQNLGNYFDPIINAQIAQEIQEPAIQEALASAGQKKNPAELSPKNRAYRVWQALSNFEAVQFADLQFVVETKLTQVVHTGQKIILEGPGRSTLEAQWLSGLFQSLSLEIAIFHLYISPSETVKRSATRFYVTGIEKPFISYQAAKKTAELTGSEPYRRPEDEDSDGIMNRYNRLYADIFAQIISIYQLQALAKVLTVDAHQTVDKVSTTLQTYLTKWYNLTK